MMWRANTLHHQAVIKLKNISSSHVNNIIVTKILKHTNKYVITHPYLLSSEYAWLIVNARTMPSSRHCCDETISNGNFTLTIWKKKKEKLKYFRANAANNWPPARRPSNPNNTREREEEKTIRIVFLRFAVWLFNILSEKHEEDKKKRVSHKNKRKKWTGSTVARCCC